MFGVKRGYATSEPECEFLPWEGLLVHRPAAKRRAVLSACVSGRRHGSISRKRASECWRCLAVIRDLFIRDLFHRASYAGSVCRSPNCRSPNVDGEAFREDPFNEEDAKNGRQARVTFTTRRTHSPAGPWLFGIYSYPSPSVRASTFTLRGLGRSQAEVVCHLTLLCPRKEKSGCSVVRGILPAAVHKCPK
jgi:hypothetical protein